MRYLGMAPMAQDALLADLQAMPDYLAAAFTGLSAAEAAVPGPDGALAPVEQCWHLADLEREGYGLRIQRLLGEVDPVLADFDGARIARERAYRARSLAEGLAAFRDARHQNLARLRSLTPDQWSRGGSQEGVGAIALCDVPAMMAEHDAGTGRKSGRGWARARRVEAPGTHMPRQNCVTPFSELFATDAHGTLMGIRGVLHDDQRRIRRAFVGTRWIFCVLQFKNRHRIVMTPKRYTELFFLDEATALAAGHRPCAECQRPRYLEFRDAWAHANPGAARRPAPLAVAIVGVLHAERLLPEGRSERTVSGRQAFRRG